MVKGRSSPDDASLREYWWERRQINIGYLSSSDVDLANDQDWLCPTCGQELINGEPLERHHKTARSEGGSEARSKRVLLHLYCHQQETAAWRKGRRMSRRKVVT
jgi:RNA-directed DNA polymerase